MLHVWNMYHKFRPKVGKYVAFWIRNHDSHFFSTPRNRRQKGCKSGSWSDAYRSACLPAMGFTWSELATQISKLVFIFSIGIGISVVRSRASLELHPNKSYHRFWWESTPNQILLTNMAVIIYGKGKRNLQSDLKEMDKFNQSQSNFFTRASSEKASK